jgi:ParB family chromosome partitioning protein
LTKKQKPSIDEMIKSISIAENSKTAERKLMAKKLQKKRNALGRGLSALLDDNDTVNKPQRNSNPLANTSDEKVVSQSNFQEIHISLIEVNPFQPRIDFDQDAIEELAESIRVQGIIQPITVRRLSENSFQLISGERRFQASQKAGLEKIPAYIRTADDQQMLEMAIIENIQRENLNAVEVALSYQRLMDECNLKQEELGERVGKKRASVNNYLRLLKLPPSIQSGVRDKRISFGHARALINVENTDFQLALFEKIVTEGLSVRKVEELVRNAQKEKEEPELSSKPKQINPEVVRLQANLSSHFGTKIQVVSDAKSKGNITIPFVSLEDLNRILEILDIES